jgi:hypothetical protein
LANNIWRVVWNGWLIWHIWETMHGKC